MPGTRLDWQKLIIVTFLFQSLLDSPISNVERDPLGIRMKWIENTKLAMVDFKKNIFDGLSSER